MADEEEQIIQQTIQPEQTTSLADFKTRIKKWEDETPFYMFWYYDFKRGLKEVLDVHRKIHCFWQRGRRGYSYRDLWSFDYYLSNVISKGLRDLAKITHGFPDQHVGSFENWQRLLFIIADAFEEHNYEDDSDLYSKDTEEYGVEEALERFKKRYEIRKEKMKLLIEYWGNLWD